MRADRLISLLMCLQSRPGLTARQLAQELEVSERTIYRDMTALNTAGIPVYARSGPGGGCYLVDAYRTNLTGMTGDQMRALFTLSIPAPLDQLGFSQDLKAAMYKLSAALPDSQRRQETHIRQRLYLDWGFDGSREAGTGQLKTVQQAIWEDRLLRLCYRSLYSPWIDPLERVVEPYGLVAWAGEWYLVCFWEDMAHVIRLRLIDTAGILPGQFTRSPGFDLAKFWLDWRRHHELDRPQYPVRVRVSALMASSLRNMEIVSTEEDDWVSGTLLFESFEHARDSLLSYGGAVQVLEPEALRCSVLDFAGQILQRYQPQGG